MASAERLIEIPYSPRRVFLPYHHRKERFAAIVAHRRAGKTVAAVNDLIKDALTCTARNPRCAYIAPLYTQAKDIAWGYAKEFAAPIPGAVVNESELRIDFPNGGRLRLYGADNYDRLRGIYLDAVVLDEPADFPPEAWPTVIRPALADRQGKATFIGTPKGKNAFWSTWQRASSSDDWFAMMLKASESGLVAQDELQAARAEMGEDRYAQEFECSFEAAIQGAYYGTEMQTATEEGRICGVPVERGPQVWTAWDLGVDDATAIWFMQPIGREVHMIDYYEASGMDATHYVRVLRERGYDYAEHILPHDAGYRQLRTAKPYSDGLKEDGLEGKITVLPRTGDLLADINETRRFIAKCWFDQKRCERGVEALRQYRRAWNEKLQTWQKTPLHDWTSHGADAFRALATGYQPAQQTDYFRNRGRARAGGWLGA